MIDTIVIGAGISGLTAAFHLQRAGRSVAVVEAGARVGGAITTERRGDFLFELGPNTVVANDPAVDELIADAGLAARRLAARPVAKKRYLWKGDRLVALPSGPVGAVRTPLFSWRGKLRVLAEPFIGRRKESGEETIGDFVRRRLGKEMLDFAVGPFVSGVYAGDPERLAVSWAVPKIHRLEVEHGGLIRGAFARRKGPAPGGQMFSFPDGLEELPRRLAERVGDVRTGLAASAVEREGAGYVVTAGGERLVARRVIVSTPSDVAARICDRATRGASAPLADVPYAAVATVGLGFRREDVAHALDGFGFLVPRGQGLRILGCLFPSELFPGRAPSGHVTLTVFTGGRMDPEAASLPEPALVEMVLGDLRRAVGLRGDPVVTVVRRWQRAIPQYELGHGRFVDAARAVEQALPGVRFAANFLGGVSVADCIRNATALARSL